MLRPRSALGMPSARSRTCRVLRARNRTLRYTIHLIAHASVAYARRQEQIARPPCRGFKKQGLVHPWSARTYCTGDPVSRRAQSRTALRMKEVSSTSSKRTRGLAFANKQSRAASIACWFFSFSSNGPHGPAFAIENDERVSKKDREKRKSLRSFAFRRQLVCGPKTGCARARKREGPAAHREGKKKRWSHWSVKQLGLVETLSLFSFPHHRDSRTTRSTLNCNGRRELIRLPLPVTITFSNTIRLALDPIHREKKNTL